LKRHIINALGEQTKDQYNHFQNNVK